MKNQDLFIFFIFFLNTTDKVDGAPFPEAASFLEHLQAFLSPGAAAGMLFFHHVPYYRDLSTQ